MAPRFLNGACDSAWLHLAFLVLCTLLLAFVNVGPPQRKFDATDANSSSTTFTSLASTLAGLSNRTVSDAPATSEITTSLFDLPVADPSPAATVALDIDAPRLRAATNDSKLEAMVCDIIRLRGGKLNECESLLNQMLETEASFLKEAMPFARMRNREELPACVRSAGIASLWFVGDSLARTILDSLAKRWPKSPGTVPPKYKGRFEAVWVDNNTGAIVDANFDFQSKLNEANFTRLIHDPKSLFVATGGMWHQGYFGTPPSALFDSVLQGLSNMFKAFAAVNATSTSTLVYYIHHCTTLSDMNLHSFCWRPTWSAMWRRSAACAVVQHWKDHPESKVHAYDPCGVVGKIADPPSRWDGSHWRELAQHLVTDDILRRFVCPATNESTPSPLPGTQAWSRETSDALATAFDCPSNPTELDREWKYDPGCACLADRLSDECDLTFMMKHFPKALKRTVVPVAFANQSEHPSVQFLVHVNRLKAYWADRKPGSRPWKGLRPDLVETPAQMNDILSTLCYHPLSFKLCLFNLGAQILTRVERTNVSLAKEAFGKLSKLPITSFDSICRCADGARTLQRDTHWCDGAAATRNLTAALHRLNNTKRYTRLRARPSFTSDDLTMMMLHEHCVRKF